MAKVEKQYRMRVEDESCHSYYVSGAHVPDSHEVQSVEGKVFGVDFFRMGGIPPIDVKVKMEERRAKEGYSVQWLNGWHYVLEKKKEV